MNCDNVKDLIAGSFGDEKLPEDILEHLEGCKECSEYYSDLMSLSSEINDESMFELTREEFDTAVANIESRIDQNSVKKSKASIWRTYIPAAAAVVLLLGVSMMTKFYNGSDGTTVNTNTDTLLAQTEVIEIQLSDDSFDNLLNETEEIGQYYNGAEDELTEEEYNYLSANLEVGDLL